MPLELAEYFEHQARERDVSTSLVVREVLREHLKRRQALGPLQEVGAVVQLPRAEARP